MVLLDFCRIKAGVGPEPCSVLVVPQDISKPKLAETVYMFSYVADSVVVQVRWSGEHVPGSPFVVMIFDTEEELNRFLQVSSLHTRRTRQKRRQRSSLLFGGRN